MTSASRPTATSVLLTAVGLAAASAAPPVVLNFSADRSEFDPLEVLDLNWEVSGADTINIQGADIDFTTAMPSGRHGFTLPADAGAGVFTDGALVRLGSVWKFHDGADFGSDWRVADFDDSSWGSGAGELGFGDGDETTVIGESPDRTNPNPLTPVSFYFRQQFEVIGADSTLPLHITAKRDDGVVFYLNGQEILRDNMQATGEISFQTLALSTIITPNEPLFAELPVGVVPGALREGVNTIAASVHQVSPVSSDVSFDIELRYDAEVLPREIFTLTATNADGSTTTEFSLRIRNRSGADGDADRLPDAWEQNFFGNLEQGANGDFDGDGFSNGGELRAGTDPDRASSFPNILDSIQFERAPAGFILSRPEIYGGRLGVEYSNDLSADSWLDLGNFFETPGGGAAFVDPDPFRAQRPNGYYRAFLRSAQ